MFRGLARDDIDESASVTHELAGTYRDILEPMYIYGTEL